MHTAEWINVVAGLTTEIMSICVGTSFARESIRLYEEFDFLAETYHLHGDELDQQHFCVAANSVKDRMLDLLTRFKNSDEYRDL